ncbi:hypothetical protein L195_g017399, partial [Trifolium pratense]
MSHNRTRSEQRESRPEMSKQHRGKPESCRSETPAARSGRRCGGGANSVRLCWVRRRRQWKEVWRRREEQSVCSRKKKKKQWLRFL